MHSETLSLKEANQQNYLHVEFCILSNSKSMWRRTTDVFRFTAAQTFPLPAASSVEIFGNIPEAWEEKKEQRGKERTQEEVGVTQGFAPEQSQALVVLVYKTVAIEIEASES